jgi:hypothetical protein
LSLPEAEGLFKTDASVSVSVTTDGKIVVNAPRYVGVVSWKGDQIAKEIEKARKFASRPTALAGYRPPAVFALAASMADIHRVREATVPKRRQEAKKSLKAVPKAKPPKRSAGRK